MRKVFANQMILDSGEIFVILRWLRTKDRHFQTKAAIANRLPLLCNIIIAGYQTQIYADRVNSWLVIQNFSQ